MSYRKNWGQYDPVPTTDKDIVSVSGLQGRPARRTRPRTSEYKLDDGSDGALVLPVPWASIALALFLTVFGIVSFILAWLHFTQKIMGKERAEISFTLLGALTFIPGFYHTWIAYNVWRGVPGYNWDSIPRF
mmetsp:Transcript_4582/g.12518  ORF Transcript_4582/g.12518 Transcript_4582/m.12518 type:complete len:132 (-) Transcript_4582:263-658(-)